MELLAAIRALQALKKKCRLVLHTDSKYLVEGINKGWAIRWRSKHWWITANRRAKNSDLWAELLTLIEAHEVKIVWVKGHVGIEDNERADRLAESAATRPDLPPDEGYERLLANPEPMSIPEGTPCFKCGTPVVKREPKLKPKHGLTHCYQWFMYCPSCKSTYTTEDAKRIVVAPPQLPLCLCRRSETQRVVPVDRRPLANFSRQSTPSNCR